MTELVTITIDGEDHKVAKGMNIVDAAASVGVDIPHYCYHPHLSVAGNCRMCQVELNGRPKLEIACNTTASEGLKVNTHHTSKAVKDAQAATLEFILINHPLDCTVCDQAGHCKLQDYHYEYNARPSRFLEEKEHKVKAQPLGPTVMLDGERCIMCSRCVRFCDEITKTSEIGLINRGDKTVIAVDPKHPLSNPLSGTVVDLCPVGALTHREWRFNTRIWFTKQADAICPGCSTGCNVKVATRDGEVVQVKARHNAEVNKEWLCDEGRYGFMRFLPKKRITGVQVHGKAASLQDAAKALKGMQGEGTYVFIAPDLTTEEYRLLKKLKDTALKSAHFVLAYKERSLTDVEKVLISPDYAPNFKGALMCGLVEGNLQKNYEDALAAVIDGSAKQVLVFGDRGILASDASVLMTAAVGRASLTAFIGTDATHPLAEVCSVVIGARSILERSGVLVNRGLRVQYTDKVIEPPQDTVPTWKVLSEIAKVFVVALPAWISDRDVTLWYLAEEQKLAGMTIKSIKQNSLVIGDAHGN
jgi:NADH-quinone oxidoreductase subunit G